MNRYLPLLVLASLLVSPLSITGASALDAYYVRPSDIPAGCRQVDGVFAANEKTRLVYEYKVFKDVMPAAVDRHAQSFECNGAKGSLLFFAYHSAEQRDAAERFVRPVLGKTSPAPEIVTLPRGFILVSFPSTPSPLSDVIARKASGAPTSAPTAAAAPAVSSATVPVMSTKPATSPVAAPVASSSPTPPKSAVVAAPSVASPKAVATPPAASSPKPAAAPPPPPPPVAAPAPAPAVSKPAPAPAPAPVKAAPAPVSAPPPAPAPSASLPDLPSELLTGLEKLVTCQDKGLTAEAKDICNLLGTFRRAKAFEPSVPAGLVRMGVGYRVDSFGRLEDRYYEAAIGSGHAYEVGLIPVHTFSGVEDFEAQAIIDSRRKNVALPSNEVLDKILKRQRPTQRTVSVTTGASRAIMAGGNRKIYLRVDGDRWLFLTIEGTTVEQQLRTGFDIGTLY